MKVALIGGTGYVGSYIIDELIKKKQAIYDLRVDKRVNKVGNGVVLDNFEIEKLPSYLQKNIEKYKNWID